MIVIIREIVVIGEIAVIINIIHVIGNRIVSSIQNGRESHFFNKVQNMFR